jgi:threonine dehydrogenase-like Zn-dependent dehydrogenase
VHRARAVIAVDPVDFKRETAMQLRATHTTDTMKEAIALAWSMTNGQGTDATIGVVNGDHIAEAVNSPRPPDRPRRPDEAAQRQHLARPMANPASDLGE